jgi:hypothetical protein
VSDFEPYGSAWEQCYVYFGLNGRQFDEEIASLRLAFYLAHFGMFRASGKTRELQLCGYAELVRVCRRYKSLRDLEPKVLAKRQLLVEEFLRTLSDTLKALGASPTHTLLSKIALGTTACMPAYDRYARSALIQNGISGTPSHRGLKALFGLRRHDLKRFGAQPSDNLPFMRALDVGLLETGKSIEATKKKQGK